jgi:hypothetical protein
MTWTSRKTFAALAKVSTQSEMTSGGSSLVIAIAPSDASQSLVELLDEATWVAIHVAWPRKLKTCHFLPNTSQFFHTSISSTIHQPVLLLCFLSSFSQRHATPWPLRCDTPISVFPRFQLHQSWERRQILRARRNCWPGLTWKVQMSKSWIWSNFCSGTFWIPGMYFQHTHHLSS